MPLTLEIITGERRLLRQEDVDEVIAPGSLGELGILPNHAPLITSLAPGELRVKSGGNEEEFFVSGGFLEVQADEVTVLADAAEHGGEIDAERAEEARQRALERLEQASERGSRPRSGCPLPFAPTTPSARTPPPPQRARNVAAQLLGAPRLSHLGSPEHDW